MRSHSPVVVASVVDSASAVVAHGVVVDSNNRTIKHCLVSATCVRGEEYKTKKTINQYASSPEGNAIPTGPLSDSEEIFLDKFQICLLSLVKF